MFAGHTLAMTACTGLPPAPLLGCLVGCLVGAAVPAVFLALAGVLGVGVAMSLLLRARRLSSRQPT